LEQNKKGIVRESVTNGSFFIFFIKKEMSRQYRKTTVNALTFLLKKFTFFFYFTDLTFTLYFS
jgi:hypothetical protein